MAKIKRRVVIYFETSEKDLTELYEDYGVSNIEELQIAMNKELKSTDSDFLAFLISSLNYEAQGAVTVVPDNGEV